MSEYALLTDEQVELKKWSAMSWKKSWLPW